MEIIKHEEMYGEKYIRFELTTETEKSFFKENRGLRLLNKFPKKIAEALMSSAPPAILSYDTNELSIRTKFGGGYGFYSGNSQVSVEDIISHLAAEGFISNNPFSTVDQVSGEAPWPEPK